ncbi:MAG: M14 family zinc carboxypeptidase [Bacteroidales bacterium]|nr:M14 family zinc carboxypeptidase [Bacteroidales bacterium]
MKRILFLIGIILCSHLPQAVKAQEYYFKISESDKELVNTKITCTVSIDRVEGDTIFAYANQKEFEALKALGYLPELLENPTLAIKNRGMATTIDQMANWDLYPTYEVYRSMMKKFEQDYPGLCKLDSIGTSVQGRKLYVVKISDNVLADEAEHEFFYTSTMHGDETTGYVLMLRLIDYLLSSYGTDSRVTDMVNSIAIYINPNANPDGTYYGGNHTVNNSRRYNANNVDINRNFPDPRVGENPGGNYQPETVAMMEYADSRSFVMSANIHGGIELANFPWDTWNTATNAHADHSWFYTISRQYADFAQAASPSGYFTGQGNGVTQGGDWYVITGGRQDYMNYWHNCREITLEISGTKNPASSTLPNYWTYNKEAMLSHIEWLYTGIQGTVTNTQDEPLNATITIANHDKDNSFVVTNPINGNYIRMIEPGTYDVNYSAEGYISQTHSISIGSNTSQVIKDVALVQAEQTSLSGIVTDGETGNPISSAKIELLNSSISPVFSNSSGQYSFASIPENTYQIKVSKEEYLSQVVTQTLTGESNTLNFSLSPSNAESFETDVPQGFTFTGGDWVRDNSTAFDGTYSMKSAPISNSQTTAMQITLDIVSDSEITFAYKVSSESGWDHLRFYVDGNENGKWSGAINWTEVTFPVTAGNHTFKWEYSKDYSSSSGSDCAWIDYIIFPQSQNDVAFTVTYSGVPVQDATVSFNELSINTNASGKAIFSNQTRGTSGQYIVGKNGFITTTGNIEVKYIDVNEHVSLEVEEYTVSFAVSNGTNPIEGATISINNEQLETNAQGEADIELPNGSYPYSVSMDGYHTQTGSIWVDEDDANVSITLIEDTEPVYNVTFYVYDEEQDVENAIITFTGRQGITDANGEYVFGGVASGTYPYTITCDGYNNKEGSVTVVSEDVNEEVLLAIENAVAIETSISSLSLWPNPFGQYLNIRLNLSRSTDVKIMVYSITGQKLATIASEYMHQGEHLFHWNPSSASSGIAQGVYFIRVITNQGERAERVIFSGK